MQLSTKGRYAVMAMAGMAARTACGPMTLQDIAAGQSLPLDYLEQLFMKLRRAGLVASVRGPGGGYALSRHPSAISIAEIMTAADEGMKMTRCKDDEEGGCLGASRCLTHDLWDALGGHIASFLQSVSLQDVVSGTLKERAAAPLAVAEAQA